MTVYDVIPGTEKRWVVTLHRYRLLLCSSLPISNDTTASETKRSQSSQRQVKGSATLTVNSDDEISSDKETIIIL